MADPIFTPQSARSMQSSTSQAAETGFSSTKQRFFQKLTSSSSAQKEVTSPSSMLAKPLTKSRLTKLLKVVRNPGHYDRWNKALIELYRHSWDGAGQRLMGEKGAVEALLRAIPPPVDDVQAADMTRKLSAVLWNLSTHDGCRASLALSGAIELLVAYMNHSDGGVRQNSTGVLLNLATVDDYRERITRLSLSPLLHLLRDTKDAAELRNAVCLLHELMKNASLRPYICQQLSNPLIAKLIEAVYDTSGDSDSWIRDAANAVLSLSLSISPHRRQEFEHVAELVRQSRELSHEGAHYSPLDIESGNNYTNTPRDLLHGSARSRGPVDGPGNNINVSPTNPFQGLRRVNEFGNAGDFVSDTLSESSFVSDGEREREREMGREREGESVMSTPRGSGGLAAEFQSQWLEAQRLMKCIVPGTPPGVLYNALTTMYTIASQAEPLRRSALIKAGALNHLFNLMDGEDYEATWRSLALAWMLVTDDEGKVALSRSDDPWIEKLSTFLLHSNDTKLQLHASGVILNICTLSHMRAPIAELLLGKLGRLIQHLYESEQKLTGSGTTPSVSLSLSHTSSLLHNIVLILRELSNSLSLRLRILDAGIILPLTMLQECGEEKRRSDVRFVIENLRRSSSSLADPSDPASLSLSPSHSPEVSPSLSPRQTSLSPPSYRSRYLHPKPGNNSIARSSSPPPLEDTKLLPELAKGAKILHESPPLPSYGGSEQYIQEQKAGDGVAFNSMRFKLMADRVRAVYIALQHEVSGGGGSSGGRQRERERDLIEVMDTVLLCDTYTQWIFVGPSEHLLTGRYVGLKGAEIWRESARLCGVREVVVDTITFDGDSTFVVLGTEKGKFPESAKLPEKWKGKPFSVKFSQKFVFKEQRLMAFSSLFHVFV